jgi:GTPase Era involved in 16S rRNA processing
MNHPKFAIVGHPNKGKSSIVSALCLDDSVAISNTPGTTTHHRSFALRVDTQVVYELFDTPGFQRARKTLAWLQKHQVSADKKDEVVRAFIQEHKDDPKFHDEVQLLTPIVEGAGIIYVVDVSKPYSSEYEAEMEILRWCNQPSMALLNSIDEDDFSHEWKKALGHYFKLVRTYNPMEATYQEHIHILESIAHLNEEWYQSVKESISLFQLQHQQMLQRASQTIVQLVQNSLSYVEKIALTDNTEIEPLQEQLQLRYKQKLRDMEKESYTKIEKIFHHTHLKKESFPLPFEKIDLFSQEAASIFGLSKKELIITAGTSGAITGAGIDLAFAGHTGFLGAMTGAIVGGVGAYFGFEELSHTKVLGKKLGQKYLQMGPMRNKNFPYILLGRAIFYTKTVLAHSHAKRKTLQLQMDETLSTQLFDATTRKELESYHKKLRLKKAPTQEQTKRYTQLIEQLLH